MTRSIRTLLALGAISVTGAAVSGCGSDIPGNAAAVVGGAPITMKAYAHWSYVLATQVAQQQAGNPVIDPDPPHYTKCIASLRKVAPPTVTESVLKTACVQAFPQIMTYLIHLMWLQGEAGSQHLTVTPAQVQAEFTKEKKASPQVNTPAGFAQFLKQTGKTVPDIFYLVRAGLLTQKLATPAAIAAYYKAHQSQFSTPASRDIRVVVTKDAASASAAVAALKHGQNWTAVSKRYGKKGAAFGSGAALTHVFSGEEPLAVNAAIFGTTNAGVLGPIKTSFGYYVVGVIKVYPAVVTPLAKASPVVKQTLLQAAVQSPPWQKKWKAKTICRTGYIVPDCRNYVAPKATTTSTGAGSPATTTAGPATTAPATTPSPATGTTITVTPKQGTAKPQTSAPKKK